MREFNEPDPNLSWEQAFNFCRRKNAPMTVVINGERWTIFPSGEAKKIGL